MAESKGRKIMICIDASEHSTRAFEWYLENIRHDDDDLRIVHAPELHPPAIPGAVATEEWRHAVEKHLEKVDNLTQKYQGEIKEKCESKGMAYKVGINYSVGDALCHEAKTKHVEMIIVGSRGMGLIRRTLIGSVSDYIIHHAHCPVIVVPCKK